MRVPMQVAEITAFMRCAELGGLSAAARAEQLPKSTLSRSLRGLEKKLKVALFERSGRGLVLTDEGRAFLPHARRILEAVEEAAAAATGFRSGPTGDVRLTAPYTFGTTFIAPLLPAFLKAHPGLNVHIELTSRNVDLTEEGFDVAVRIGAPPQALIARRLMTNRLRLCASAEYCEKHGVPRTPAELARHPLLLIGRSRSQAALKLSNGRSRVTVSTPARLLSSDPSVILQGVLAGVGVGEVPTILAHALLRRGVLIPLVPGWSLPSVDISLIYSRSRGRAPRVKALIDYLRANIRPGPESVEV